MDATNGYPPDLWDDLKPRVHAEVGDLVVLAVDEQCLNFNIVCLLPALPSFNGIDYNRLCRPLTVHSFASVSKWVVCIDGIESGRISGGLLPDYLTVWLACNDKLPQSYG